uniref:Uncharacterized protein n=1 Tax=Timema genevievae TaxID=629358 RepID=A0A7R9PJ99_TIMGE|nr:unnamed protein product [Timema genevievae]
MSGRSSFVSRLKNVMFVCSQTELSQNLQQLSEKARSTTEFIQRLKGMADKVNVSTKTFSLSECRFKRRRLG